MHEKLSRVHLDRKAAVYVRQSTLRQVRENRESTTRQYGLKGRAVALGWPAEHVDVIDEDLGHSGTTIQGRSGFQRLAEDVAHGRLGAIFSLEVSRLARSSADWHRLLDLCALADVLIIDEQSIFSPRDGNDRLVLGLQGSMSEAEQVWRRLRLQGGKLNKAQRGELFVRTPIGYEWDKKACRYRVDPDQQVQRFIQLVFERFRLDGSARAVARYLVRQGLKAPRRDRTTRELSWARPQVHHVVGILRNPVYAGAYVFGRTQERTALVDGQVKLRQVKRLSCDEWPVCLKNHHPGYIDWNQYVSNQGKLTANSTRCFKADLRGAPREGQALLQGLALCGKCGNRMYSVYRGSGGRWQYRCQDRGNALSCDHWSVAGRAIDEAVAQLFLQVVQPPEIELGLAVMNEVNRQAEQVERQWTLRREQAQYEARLAEKRYKSVDPDNRAVAQTLETEWNEKLEQIQELQSEYEEVLHREKLALSDDERRTIVALAKDLPRVWQARSTTHADRKNLLRMVIREVALSPLEVPTRSIRIQILWKTEAVTELVIARVDGSSSQETPPEALAVIKRLIDDGCKSEMIARELNRRRLRTGRGTSWTRPRVNAIVSRYKMRRRGAPKAAPRASRGNTGNTGG